MMIEDSTNTIKLQPLFKYYLFNQTLSISGLIVTSYLLTNSQSKLTLYLCFGLFLFFLFQLLYKYLDIYICTKWIITDSRIIIKKGILIKSINYIELYRVIDYEERTNFFFDWIKITNLFIYSSDKSTPKLKIFGIKSNLKLLDEIRKRVEITRKENNSIIELNK